VCDALHVVEECGDGRRPETIVFLRKPELRTVVIDETILVKKGVIVDLDFDGGLACFQRALLATVNKLEKSA